MWNSTDSSAEDVFLAWHYHGHRQSPPPLLFQRCVTLLGTLYMQRWWGSHRRGQTYSILAEKLNLLKWKEIKKVQTQNYMLCSCCTIDKDHHIGVKWWGGTYRIQMQTTIWSEQDTTSVVKLPRLHWASVQEIKRLKSRSPLPSRVTAFTHVTPNSRVHLSAENGTSSASRSFSSQPGTPERVAPCPQMYFVTLFVPRCLYNTKIHALKECHLYSSLRDICI